MKKNRYIFFFLLLFLSISISAQGQKESRQKINALKIAYITEQLDLTEKEAQKFWPVYNTYDKKLRQLHYFEKRKLKKKIRDLGGLDALTDDQAKSIALKMLSLDQQAKETAAVFFEKLSNILTYKKILKLRVAEGDFKRKLLKKLRRKKELKN